MKIFKRVIAYFIDLVLVVLVSTLLSNNSYINKDYNKYKKTYEEYENKYIMYEDLMSDIETYYKDEEIDEKEIDKLIESYPNYKAYFNDIEKITEDNYDKIIENINKDLIKEQENYSYKLSKYSVISSIVRVMCFLLYFVVIQYYLGNTLGKKIMKLKVVSNNDKKINIINYLIRSLIVNELFINILNIIFLLFLSKKSFIMYSNIMYVITYVIEVAIIFMMAFTKENRGLHDFAANTKVIELNNEKNNCF